MSLHLTKKPSGSKRSGQKRCQPNCLTETILGGHLARTNAAINAYMFWLLDMPHARQS